MSYCVVVLVIFLLGASNAVHYLIPSAKVQAFKPQGFRIAIDDSPGITLVAFNININEEMKAHKPGEYSADLTHPHDGQWTFHEPHRSLKIGDVLNYWVYVSKDGERYTDSQSFQVAKLEMVQASPSGSFIAVLDQGQSLSKICRPCQPCTLSNDQHYPSQICGQLIANSTNALLSKQAEINLLTKTNQQLIDLIGKYPDVKQLKLSGMIPPDGDADSTVRFILREKLDLSPNIIAARRNGDGSITFEVATLDDKLEIIEEAKDKLKNSRILILP